MTTFERGVAIIGIGLAAITAALFYVQLNEMTKQTQILASQNESAAAGGLMDGMNTRKQLVIAQIQAKAAQESVAAIRRQTFQADRPWIAVDIAIQNTNDFSFDENGAAISLKATLRNTGLSVANHVNVYTALQPSMEWPAALEHLCSIPKSPANTSKIGSGYVMFPGQQIIDNMTSAYAAPQEIVKAAKKFPMQGSLEAVGFNLIICVDYMSVIDSAHHQTRRVYMMGWTDTTRNTAMGAFEPKKHYSGMGLVPMLAGDSAD